MNFAAVEEIARAVLYEGYLLYPYRPSALKNRQRWMFGRLLPQQYCLAHGQSEPWKMQTECLVAGTARTEIDVSVRFLQLVGGGDADGDPARQNSAACETVEREVAVTAKLEQILDYPLRTPFAFLPLLEGAVTLAADQLEPGSFKLAVVIENLTPAGAHQNLDQALFQSLLSTHTLLGVKVGDFISLLDPPEPYRLAAANCRHVGAWPVLVGPEPGKTMLSSPIILYDYPQVASESPGDLFDNTEIDELLSLRIQTLTDAEKREMRASSDHARAVLERIESLAEDQLLQLHGRLQNPTASRPGNWLSTPPSSHTQLAAGFQPGDRVRLRPRRTADALDLLLRGKTATVVSVQHDFEDRIHLGVVLDDDPGRDFGVQGLPGHRFFYHADEVERI